MSTKYPRAATSTVSEKTPLLFTARLLSEAEQSARDCSATGERREAPRDHAGAVRALPSRGGVDENQPDAERDDARCGERPADGVERLVVVASLALTAHV